MKISILWLALSLGMAPVQADTWLVGDQQAVAAVLMGEAGVDGVKGLEAVGELIVTRCRERRLSPRGVVTERRQFAALSGTSLGRMVLKFEKSPLWPKAMDIARRVHHEPKSFSGVTKGANHFTVKTESPRWARGHKPVTIIGAHAFYKL